MTITQPSTILIADDEANARDVLEDLLGAEGYNLIFAADGEQALQKAAAYKPDLILLDVMMPGMDGFEVCRRLRADENLRQVPIVMVTTLDDRDSRLRGIEAGADDFLAKPYDRIELRLRARTITRLNRYRHLLEQKEQLEQAHNDLLKAYDDTLEGWAHALDLRDKETKDHTRRVTELSVQLAQVIGVDGSALIHFRRGALLHDIGKIGILDAILHKPGKLDDAEWQMMRQHPTYAYEMLAPIIYLYPALDIPFCHHERWDGTGYPRGLKGTEIPLAARIFAIIDVWDALTNDRPYRKAMSREEALGYIREQSGKHFDPQVVEAFLKLVNE